MLDLPLLEDFLKKKSNHRSQHATEGLKLSITPIFSRKSDGDARFMFLALAQGLL
jgi:hypothetical protein